MDRIAKTVLMLSLSSVACLGLAETHQPNMFAQHFQLFSTGEGLLGGVDPSANTTIIGYTPIDGAGNYYPGAKFTDGAPEAGICYGNVIAEYNWPNEAFDGSQAARSWYITSTSILGYTSNSTSVTCAEVWDNNTGSDGIAIQVTYSGGEYIRAAGTAQTLNIVQL